MDNVIKLENPFSGASQTVTIKNTSGVKGSVGQIDWRHFNVAKGEKAQFGFSNNNQMIINRC